MKLYALWVTLIALYAVTWECNGIAYPFLREISIRNVGNVKLNSDFNKKVASYVNKAISPLSVSTDSVVTVPDISIIANSWFNGTANEVNGHVAELAKVFDSWRKTPNSDLLRGLNELCVKEFGIQPTKIDFPLSCAYEGKLVGEGAPDYGPNNLTVVFETKKDPRISLVSSICKILSLSDCSLVRFDSSVASQGNTNLAFVTVTSSDRSEALLVILDHARFASLLSQELIVSMKVAGTLVYYEGDPPNLTEKGDVASCASQYWYAIFLLLLIPIVLILAQRFYYSGEDSGINSVRATEWDIRGGVRYQDRITAQYGGGFQGTMSMYNSRHPGPHPPPQEEGFGNTQRDTQQGSQYGHTSQHGALQSGQYGIQNDQFKGHHVTSHHGQRSELQSAPQTVRHNLNSGS